MPAYLDHAATTPIVPAAIEAMADAARRWANPSSVHADGRAAKAMLEEARERVAAGLGCAAREVVFTSGGTEAIGLALRGAAHVVSSAVEHDAVRREATGGVIVPVDRRGVIDLGALASAVRSGAIVAVQHANNETGVVQPIAEVARLAREAGATLLVDAVQTAGKMGLPEGDLIAVSAHKIGGPPGVGALIVRDFDRVKAVGGQERGYRAGTENLPAIMGFSAAVDALSKDWLIGARRLRERLEARLPFVNGAEAERLPNISSIRMAGVPAATQVIAFDMAGFRVSAGAACSSGKVAVSHVLTAMGVEGPGEAVRVSLGPQTTEAEIDAFADAWDALAARRTAA